MDSVYRTVSNVMALNNAKMDQTKSSYAVSYREPTEIYIITNNTSLHDTL